MEVRALGTVVNAQLRFTAASLFSWITCPWASICFSINGALGLRTPVPRQIHSHFRPLGLC